MEVVAGSAHSMVPMTDGSRLGEARWHAQRCALALGLDEATCARVEAVVTGLADHLVRHARGGRLLIGSRTQASEVEVIAIDEGPGIADLNAIGTADHPMAGLAEAKQQAHHFAIHTTVPDGTVVVARLRRPGAAPAACAFDFGAISVPAPGESVCGDAWILACEDGQARLMLCDGLGHGPGAAQASAQALTAFALTPMAQPARHLRQAHEALGGSRGAALSVFALDAARGLVRMSGAGNVLGRVISGVSDKSLMPQNGTAGVRIRTPDEVATDWPAHAVLVAFSDGIESRWDARLLHPLLTAEPTLLAAVLLRDHQRGPDDATVVVIRRNP